METRRLVPSARIGVSCFHYSFFLLSLLAVKAAGLYLHNGATEVVSDGIGGRSRQGGSSFLRLKGTEYSNEYYCSDQMYGFLPCSSTLTGHLFLVMVYEYLLFQGESLTVSGGSRLFEILGPGVFGASAFPVIGPLPESLILLISGLVASKEEAQEYVITGVGLLAGSTIFLLTVLWGTCVIVGSQKFPSNPIQNEHESSSLSCTGSGVTTDAETSDTARIMLFSLMPFIIILIPKAFAVPYSSGVYKIDILITLIVSIISLLAYFYKMSDEHIQVRRLQYVEVEHELLVFDIIQRVQEHISEPLLTEDGAPNEAAIRSLFKKMDKNTDGHISYLELKALLEEIKLCKLTWDWEKVMDKLTREFDLDENKKITWEEFQDRVKIWIEEIKSVLDEPNHSKTIREVVQQLIEQKRKDEETMKHLTLEIFQHSLGSQLGSLPTDNEALRKVFESIDEDKDDIVSLSELRKKFLHMNLGDILLDEGDAAEKIMRDFDKNKNSELNFEEFITGIRQWHQSPSNLAPTSLEHANHRHQGMMNKGDKTRSAKTKAAALLVLGLAILVVLAEPLIHSVRKFSTSAGIPSFYVAFILVPLATNARTAISAVRAASQEKQMPFKQSQKNETAASLTFSEIYHGVFMNNVLGMVVLLSVIYLRGLTWHFSFEVLAALVVCAAMGLLAGFRSYFPIWTASIAYMLYVASLILVYLLNDAFQSP